MAPFQYDTPGAPLAGSIADAMLRGGDIRAQMAVETARINAAAASQRGQIWGNTVNQLSQLPLQISAQRRADEIAQSNAQYRNMQMAQIGQQLQEHQQTQQQQKLFSDSINELAPKYKSTDPVTKTPVIDFDGLTDELRKRGLPDHLITDWTGRAMQSLSAVSNYAKQQIEDSTRVSNELANVAWDSLTPANFAMNLRTAVQQRKVPEQVAQATLQQLNEQGDNYENFVAGLKGLAPAVAKQRADMAKTAAETKHLEAQAEAERKKVPTPLSPEQQKLQAYAASLNLPPGTPLNDAQLQAYGQREANAKTDEALKIYKAQRDYAVAHPLNEEKTTAAKTTRGVLAQQLVDGNLSPSNLSKRGDYNDILADATTISLEKTGKPFNINKAQLDYEAAKKFVAGQNSDRRVAYRGLATSVVNTIDEVTRLGDELKQGGLAAWNKASRNTVRSVYGNTPQSELANRYIVAVNTLKEEFANLANGGYAPTDAAWKLANDQINGDYGFKDLRSSLTEVQRLVNYRTQAMNDQQPMTISDPNAPKTTGSADDPLDLWRGKKP